MAKQHQSKETASAFWTTKRLDVIASLPCWDVVLAQLDGKPRLAAEIARITGRTPGALFAPLKRLETAGIIHSESRQPDGKGRPGREYTIDPGAREKPCGSGREYERAVHKATSAGLRLIMRNSGLLAEENLKVHKAGNTPKRSARWIQFSNLDEEDLAWIEQKLQEIMQRFADQRTNTDGARYRGAFMLIPDDFEETDR